ncbi:nuclease-related domain-containing protein [Pseudoclavibacter soli]|uniref:nuclease-related domain-containing protein n=1 Tax=Pseudoclavibacter soli TaxID=452623 RepID=UPI0004033151|nr:nuclease-related domain-containing protein [Pseudoclavibacter soli]
MSFGFRGWSRGAASRVYVTRAGVPIGHIDLVSGRRHPRAGAADCLDEAAQALSARLGGVTAPELEPIVGDLADRRPGQSIERLADSNERFAQGLAAEQRTAAVLDAATGIRVLHSVPLTRDHDIDHIVVTAGGVFAINTKSTVHTVLIHDGTVSVAGYRQEWLAKADSDAGTLETLLRRQGLAIDVTPAVVVWAAGVDGYDASVIPGEQLDQAVHAWLHEHTLAAPVADAAYEIMRRPDFWAGSAR